MHLQETYSRWPHGVYFNTLSPRSSSSSLPHLAHTRSSSISSRSLADWPGCFDSLRPNLRVPDSCWGSLMRAVSPSGTPPKHLGPLRVALHNFGVAFRHRVFWFTIVNFLLDSALCVSIGVSLP